MAPKIQGLWLYKNTLRSLYSKSRPKMPRTKSSESDLDADYKRARKKVIARANRKPIKVDAVTNDVMQPRLVWQTSSDSTMTLEICHPKIKIIENNYSELVAWTSIRPLKPQCVKLKLERKPIEGTVLLENYFDTIALERIKKYFSQKTKIKLPEFQSIIKKSLKSTTSNLDFESDIFEYSVSDLYNKINKHCTDYVTPEDFWDYMYYMTKLKPPAELEWTDMEFGVPAKLVTQIYKVPITRARDTEDGYLVLLGEDGMLSVWNSRLKNIIKKRLLFPGCSITWFTDFAFAASTRKLIIGTGNAELHLWSTWALEPSCRIMQIGMVPYRLEFGITTDQWENKSEAKCILVFGDANGNIGTVSIESPRNVFQAWHKGKSIADVPAMYGDVAFSLPGVTYRRNRVHSLPVTKLILIMNAGVIISSSKGDPNRGIVIGKAEPSPIADIPGRQRKLSFVKESDQFPKRQSRDETIFSIQPPIIDVTHCIEKKEIYVAEERKLSIWNIYVTSRPSHVITSFKIQIHSINFIEDLSLLHVVTIDRCITLLNVNDGSIFGTIKTTDSRIPTTNNMITSFYSTVVTGAFLHFKTGLYFMTIARKKASSETSHNTHTDPIVAVLFNERFKAIVTVSETTITMWSLDTGELKFFYVIVEKDHFLGAGCYNEEIYNEEIQDMHSNKRRLDALRDNSRVTCAKFDTYFQRLITGHRSGAVKLWNIFNGHLIMVIKNPDAHSEVGAVHHVLEYRRHPAFLMAGWEKAIRICLDLGGTCPKVQNLENAHTDDIDCMTSYGTILATASSNGQICLWNMIADNKIMDIYPKPPKNVKIDPNDTQITKLDFFNYDIKKGDEKKDHDYLHTVSTLLAAGPYNRIYAWNVGWKVSGIAKLMSSFEVTPRVNTSLTTFSCQRDLGYLYTADNVGNVYCWDVAKNPPTLLTNWMAHTKCINNIEVLRHTLFVLTSSEDRSVRIWTLSGEMVGVYGQKVTWQLGDIKTYLHPIQLKDILFDQSFMSSQYLKDYPEKTDEILAL